MNSKTKKTIPIVFAAVAVVILLVAAIVATSKPKLGDEVIISFNNNGQITTQTKRVGQLVDEPSNITKTHYTLTGWYKEESCTNKWTFADDKVTQALTLYAGWELVPYATISASSPMSGVNQSLTLTDKTSDYVLESIPATVRDSVADAEMVYEINGRINQAETSLITSKGFATGAYAISLSFKHTGYGTATSIKVNDTVCTADSSNRIAIEVPSTNYGFVVTYTFTDTTVSYVFYTSSSLTMTSTLLASANEYTGVNQTITVTKVTGNSEVKKNTTLANNTAGAYLYRIDGTVSTVSASAALEKGFAVTDHVVSVHVDTYQYAYTKVILADNNGATTDITTSFNADGDVFAKISNPGDGFWITFLNGSGTQVAKVLFYTMEAPFVVA